ncbi:hypothetical protein BK658_19650 [Pseudomonas brassicacearum]|uniref:Uncharacterized protein n=2 Tax=Pseudomonas brassicacearum TaxID=930166 RepID=A0A423GNL5_9PSED|nr:hypothetical protein BK658_19650 [Pseudomonas brassicacearum]
MNIREGSRNERTITGALLSSKNNAGMNLAKVLHQDAPYTKEAAYRDLAKQACEDLYRDKANVVLNDTTNHGKRLREHAINLFILSKENEVKKSASYTAAFSAFQKAVDAYEKVGEKDYSSTCNVSSSGGYKANTDIEKAIDKVVKENLGVFDTAAGTMHDMYLRDGLPKAEGRRLGLTLDEQSMVNSSFCGNATSAANSALSDQLNLFVKEGGGVGLTHFVSAMLNQLDLGADPTGRRSKESKPPTAGPLRDGNGAGSAVRDIIQNGGGASVGDINVNLDGLSKMADVQAKALDIIAQLIGGRNSSPNNPTTDALPDDRGRAHLQPNGSLTPSPAKRDAASQDPLKSVGGLPTESIGNRFTLNDARQGKLIELGKFEIPGSKLNVSSAPPKVASESTLKEGVGTFGPTGTHATATTVDKLGVPPQVISSDKVTSSDVAGKGPAAPTASIVVPNASPIPLLESTLLSDVFQPAVRAKNNPQLTRAHDELDTGAQKISNNEVRLPSTVGNTATVPAASRLVSAAGTLEASIAGLSGGMALDASSVGDGKSTYLGQASLSWWSGKLPSLELKPELMPQRAPEPVGLLRYKGEPTSAGKAFLANIASGIQSLSADAQTLKNYIKGGRNPSQAKADSSDEKEAKTFRIFAEAKKQSPEFVRRVEKLFGEYNGTSAVRFAGMSATDNTFISSLGGSTSVAGNPKRESVSST